ncbi:hypothetical protein Hanom_Chr11g01038881 [Helianthus anomalus]
MILYFSNCSSTKNRKYHMILQPYFMDPKNNSHSLLKLIEEYDPIFLVFILDGPKFLAATMLDRDMLAIAVNWYHVGWFCLVRLDFPNKFA